MDENEVKHMLINPFYAINFDPDLAQKHESLVSEDRWIEANLQLVKEIGAEEWLTRLLAVLQGDYPRNPDESGADQEPSQG